MAVWCKSGLKYGCDLILYIPHESLEQPGWHVNVEKKTQDHHAVYCVHFVPWSYPLSSSRVSSWGKGNHAIKEVFYAIDLIGKVRAAHATKKTTLLCPHPLDGEANKLSTQCVRCREAKSAQKTLCFRCQNYVIVRWTSTPFDRNASVETMDRRGV